MAANTVLRRERVIYIDTDGSFSAKRFAAMHERLGSGSGNTGAGLVAALQHVELYRVHDLHDLLALLGALQQYLQVHLQQSALALLYISTLKG